MSDTLRAQLAANYFKSEELQAACKHVWEADGQCLFMCSLCGLETDCPLCVGKRTVPSAKDRYVKDCPACCGEEG